MTTQRVYRYDPIEASLESSLRALTLGLASTIQTEEEEEEEAAAAAAEDALRGEDAEEGGTGARRRIHVDPLAIYEEELIQRFAEDPSQFDRHKTARQRPERKALRDMTGASDEQIEGWAVMFKRNVISFEF